MYETTVYDLNGNQITSLVQWDKDVTVCISEPDITEAYQAHFFNEKSEQALVVNTSFKDGTLIAKIPNILLEEPYVIIGYVYNEDDSGTRSIYCFRIPIRHRPVPSTYVFVDDPDYLDVTNVLEECKEYAANASNSADESAEYASNSAASAEESDYYSQLSESWAVGGTGIRSGEDTNNSKYYSEQSQSSAEASASSAAASKESETNAAASASESAESAAESADSAASSFEYAFSDDASAKHYYELCEEIAESFESAVRPMGSIYFKDLPSIFEAEPGDMYNIIDEFVTTDEFVEGAGYTVRMGSNVLLRQNSADSDLLDSNNDTVLADANDDSAFGSMRDCEWDVLGGVDADVEKSDIDSIFNN